MDKRPRAICLLSGGIDSAVAAHMAREHYDLTRMSIEYGNPTAEKLAAISIGDWLEIPSILCRIPSWSAQGEDPTNYFPARNTVFLAHALLECEVGDFCAVVVGANADDQRDYPDCRPEYFRHFAELAYLGTRIREFRIFAPLLKLSKAEIVAEAIKRGVPLKKTMSCYRPRDRTPCGTCAACNLRRSAYEANGLEFKADRLEADFGESKPWA